MTAARSSDVRYWGVECKPTARCQGVLDHDIPDPTTGGHSTVTRCDWDWQSKPGYPGLTRSGAAKYYAREHALRHPGHEVVVEQRNVTKYWLPTSSASDEEKL